MKRKRLFHLAGGLMTAALVGALSLWSAAGAAEVHFVVRDVGEKRAVWVPQEVVLHRSTEMDDGIAFVLENPTDRTHAFAAYGLFEEITGAQETFSPNPYGSTSLRRIRSGCGSARRNLKDARMTRSKNFRFSVRSTRGMPIWAGRSVWFPRHGHRGYEERMRANVNDVHLGGRRRVARMVLALLLVVGGSGVMPAMSLAGTFHFVIHDVEGGAAAWFPREVVIHKRTDLDGGLIFMLENPTPRTHVFEAPGLFEQMRGPRDPKPRR